MITALSDVRIYSEREEEWYHVCRKKHAAHAAAARFLRDRLFDVADHPGRYVVLSEREDRDRHNRLARYVRALWLLDEWDFGPVPFGLLLQEESRHVENVIAFTPEWRHRAEVRRDAMTGRPRFPLAFDLDLTHRFCADPMTAGASLTSAR